MKTLMEIIDAVKAGERPEYDELRYAVCALDALTLFDEMALMKLVEAEKEGKKSFMIYSAMWQFEDRFKRMKTALGKSPKDWVGWNNDPENPEYRKRVAAVIKLIDRIVSKST